MATGAPENPVLAAWYMPLPVLYRPLAKSNGPSSTLVSIINKRSLRAAYFSASDNRDSFFEALVAACSFAVISFNLASFSALNFALASAPCVDTAGAAAGGILVDGV